MQFYMRQINIWGMDRGVEGRLRATGGSPFLLPFRSPPIADY